jgi:putative membrane protein
VSVPPDPRFRLANERTLLSWMRVALALVAAGTTAGTVADIKPRWLHAGVAVVPIALGLGAALFGYRRWRRVDDSMRSGVELPPDRELRVVAVAVAVIALIAGAAALVGVFSR